MEKRYIISDASKLIDVESHVLRYWEEELGIEIPRNEMGHRYYTDYYIDLFRRIKNFKDSGFQLKAIKMVLPELMGEGEPEGSDISLAVRELKAKTHSENRYEMAEVRGEGSRIKEHGGMSPDEKLVFFKQFMGEIVSDAVKENNETVFAALNENGKNVSETVIKQMDYLLRLKEEQEEERFKRLDEIIRNYQKSQKEVAVGKEKRKKRRFLI